MRPQRRGELVKHNFVTRMNENPYEDQITSSEKDTRNFTREYKSDNHLKLRGSFSRFKTKSHKNENWRKSYSAADYQLKGSRSLSEYSQWESYSSRLNDNGNENSKKPIDLDWQNNNCRASRFSFGHFHNVKVPNFTFCPGREHKTTIFFSWALIQSLRIKLQTVERSTRRDGKDERGESFSFLSSFSPSSRDLPMTAKTRLRRSLLPNSILDDYK